MVYVVPSSFLHCKCNTTPTLLQVREGLAYSLHPHWFQHLHLLGSSHLHLLCCSQSALCLHLITCSPVCSNVMHFVHGL